MVWSPSPACKCVERDLQVARIDPEAGQRAARPQHPQTGLEGRLGAERLDGDVHAAAAGQAHDLLDRVGPGEIHHVVGAQPPGQLEPFRHPVDGDDLRGAAQLGPRRGAQPDRALREHRDDVADADIGRVRRRQSPST
jgi:hypothetical protein